MKSSKEIINKNKQSRAEKLPSPLKSIKEYCKNVCCAGIRNCWQDCNMKNCPLHAYRLGRRPKPLEKDFLKNT